MATVRINYEVDKTQVDSAETSLEQLNQTTDEATESTEEFNDSTASLTDQLKGLANQVSIGGKGLGDLVGTLGSTTAASGKASVGLRGIGLAMKAIPIVALIAAFGSLLTFFTKTERGAQRLRVATAFLEGAFGAIQDRVIGFGESLFNAITNPQKALDDLKTQFISIFTEFIPNAINNVLEGFGKLGQAISALFRGDFDEALDVASEGALQLLDGLTDLNPATAIIKSIAEEAAVLGEELIEDANAAAELENALNRLIVAERELSVERAQGNAELEREKLLAEDVTRSIEDRIASAQRAFEIESGFLERELALQRERVRIIQEQNALSESTEEDLQAEADALIRLAELEQGSLTRQIELNNKLNALEQERENRRLKQIEEQAKREEEEQKKEEERLERLRELEEERVKITEESAQRRIELERNTADTTLGLLQTLGNKGSEFAILAFALEKSLAIADVFTDLARTKAANALAAAKIAAIAPPFTLGQAATYLATTNAAAGANAALQVASIGAQILTAPRFAEGVIDLQGGVRGKDSIMSFLMPGESVMTTKETNDFYPTLTAIRKGYVDPDLLNRVATGSGVIDNSKVVEVPRDSFTIDEEGFTRFTAQKMRKMKIKSNRHKW